MKIIELAGIGPAPFAGMMLADMGAEVLRVDRAQAVGDRRPAASHRRTGPGPTLGWSGPQAPGGPRDGPAPGRAGRRPDRGVPARCDRTARGGPRCLFGPQSAAGVRPDDRVGPGGPLRVDGGPRHQLHGAERHPGHDRASRREAGAAAQPRRRFRRRRHGAGVRSGVRPLRGQPDRAAARSSTRPWSTGPPCWPA